MDDMQRGLRKQKCQSFFSPRRVLVWLAILGLLVLIATLLLKHATDLLLYGDSLMFWAPGRLILEGKNPYDESLVIELSESQGKVFEPNDPVPPPLMVYPPWVMPILMPLGALDFSFFRLLWLAANLTAVFLAANLAWRMAGGPDYLRIAVWFFAVTFAPTARALSIGNLTPLMLLAMTSIMYLMHSYPRDRRANALAGAALAVVTIKPQLLYLLLLGVLLWAIQSRKWTFLFGMIAAITLSVGTAACFRHQILLDYVQAMLSHPVEARAVPTLGSVLRLIFNMDNFWLQFVPSAVGLAWFVRYWWRHRSNWDWDNQAPLLIAVSLATSAYAWSYDQVFWIVPLLVAASGMIRNSHPGRTTPYLVIYLCLNIVVFVTYARTFDFWLFWLPVALLTLYLVATRQLKRSTASDAAAI